MTDASNLMGFSEADGMDSRRTIPFDYAFRYELTGKPGTVLNKTVAVSVEATFVAVSIGYGVVPKVSPIIFGLTDAQLPSGETRTMPLEDVDFRTVLDALDQALSETSRVLQGETGPEATLKNGIKLNPAFAELALLRRGETPLDTSILNQLFQVVATPTEQVQFLYAMFDEGSGREFQSDPILNIAGLGISNGDRPFRYFAKPITFAPRSAIRLQVTEVSDFTGELHVSLHGYKVLGGAGTPTGIIRRGSRASRVR